MYLEITFNNVFGSLGFETLSQVQLFDIVVIVVDSLLL